MNGVASDRMPLPGSVVDEPHGPYPIGLMGLLSTVAMLFASFTAAILVRRTGTDWTPVALPPVVWINSVIILASSVAVELARRSIRRGVLPDGFRSLAAAGLLGSLFLAGQVVAWRALAAQGIFLPSSPHAAFFYMLSAVHGLHVLGGLGALSFSLRRAIAGAYTSTNHAGLTHVAIYWHFVGGVWIYLLVLLSTL